MKMAETGLALGGGAARGWAHIGVIRALREKNIRITHIAGTSIGAFVGAFVATGRLDDLEREILDFDWKHGLGYFASVPSRTGMLNGRGITEFLREHLGPSNIEDTAVPLQTVATDLRNGDEVVLARGSLVEAVRASIAVPGIFTPVVHDGRLLVDGGLINPVPVNIVRRMGARHVVAVDLNRVSSDPDTPILRSKDPNVLEIIGASANIIEAGLTRSRLVVDPPDVLVRPRLEHISFIEFNRGGEALQAGYEAAMQALADQGV
jgi:NTE family protein